MIPNVRGIGPSQIRTRIGRTDSSATHISDRRRKAKGVRPMLLKQDPLRDVLIAVAIFMSVALMQFS